MKKFLILFAVLLFAQNIYAKKWNWTPRQATNSTTMEPKSGNKQAAKITQDQDYESEVGEEEVDNLIFLNKEDFNKADLNSDGKISEDEFLLFQEKDFNKIAAKNFAEFDLNKDKMISLEEINTHLQNEDFAEDNATTAKNFATADIDDNNFLDREEFLHYQQTSLLNNSKMIFRLFDANGDGAITYEETEQILGVFQNLAAE